MERIRGELEKTSLLEEICWRQKSRVLCIREGDKNTKFFHRIANSHRRFNSIDRLMVDGELSSDLKAIAKCISRFYKQLYSKSVIHIPNVLGLAFLFIFFLINKFFHYLSKMFICLANKPILSPKFRLDS